MATSVTTLFKRNDIWLGKQWQQHEDGVSTGFIELDKQLAGQGWPTTGVVELVGDLLGVSELLQPVLRQQQQLDRWQLCVAPPAQPYAPAWAQAGIDLSRLLWISSECRKEQLWSLEHSLNSGRCSVALAWLGQLSSSEARRLQLAAQKGRCLLFIHLPESALAQSHPISLRLAVSASHSGCSVRVIKQRGGWPQGDINLALAQRPSVTAPDLMKSKLSATFATVAQGLW